MLDETPFCHQAIMDREVLPLKKTAQFPLLPAVRLRNLRTSRPPRNANGGDARKRQPNLRLQEARYAHTVVQAIRATINSEDWQRAHGVSNLQQVWKLWTTAAAAAQQQPLAQQQSQQLAGRSLPTSRSLPTLRPAQRPSKATASSTERRRLWKPSAVPPPMKMDANVLRAALALTFPSAPPLSPAEFELVYRSLDVTGRGNITLSTFSSVFAPRRCDRGEDRAGGELSYASLPSWSEAVGGYIARDEVGDDVTYDEEHRRGRRDASVDLQHGRGGRPDVMEGARGVAGGFGLGHDASTAESFGWELHHRQWAPTQGTHLEANVAKWGELTEHRVKQPPHGAKSQMRQMTRHQSMLTQSSPLRAQQSPPRKHAVSQRRKHPRAAASNPAPWTLRRRA